MNLKSLASEALGLLETRWKFYLFGFAEPSPAHAGETPETRVIAERGFARATDLPPDTTASADHFLAGAVSEVIPAIGLDIWTIDERGRIRHAQNGCWR